MRGVALNAHQPRRSTEKVNDVYTFFSSLPQIAADRCCFFSLSALSRIVTLLLQTPDTLRTKQTVTHCSVGGHRAPAADREQNTSAGVRRARRADGRLSLSLRASAAAATMMETLPALVSPVFTIIRRALLLLLPVVSLGRPPVARPARLCGAGRVSVGISHPLGRANRPRALAGGRLVAIRRPIQWASAQHTRTHCCAVGGRQEANASSARPREPKNRNGLRD